MTAEKRHRRALDLWWVSTGASHRGVGRWFDSTGKAAGHEALSGRYLQGMRTARSAFWSWRCGGKSVGDGSTVTGRCADDANGRKVGALKVRVRLSMNRRLECFEKGERCLVPSES
jgi:hypothetical protein